MNMNDTILDEHMFSTRNLRWNDTYSDGGDTANQEEFVRGVQIAFSSTAAILFL